MLRLTVLFNLTLLSVMLPTAATAICIAGDSRSCWAAMVCKTHVQRIIPRLMMCQQADSRCRLKLASAAAVVEQTCVARLHVYNVVLTSATAPGKAPVTGLANSQYKLSSRTESATVPDKISLSESESSSQLQPTQSSSLSGDT